MLEYQLIRKNIKKMYLRIKDDQIIVSAPNYVSKQEVDSFVLEHEAWINKHRINKSKIQNNDIIKVLGEEYRIVYTSNTLCIKNHVIYCSLDQYEFDELIYQYTKNYFFDRFQEICSILKIENINLQLKYYKSKWGSCTPSKKLICLNINLAFYSLRCIDAIILHELAHLYVMNHSNKFYDILLTWMPDYKEVVKELKISKIPRLEE